MQGGLLRKILDPNLKCSDLFIRRRVFQEKGAATEQRGEKMWSREE